jgi:hypothetical protein
MSCAMGAKGCRGMDKQYGWDGNGNVKITIG